MGVAKLTIPRVPNKKRKTQSRKLQQQNRERKKKGEGVSGWRAQNDAITSIAKEKGKQKMKRFLNSMQRRAHERRVGTKTGWHLTHKNALDILRHPSQSSHQREENEEKKKENL